MATPKSIEQSIAVEPNSPVSSLNSSTAVGYDSCSRISRHSSDDDSMDPYPQDTAGKRILEKQRKRYQEQLDKQFEEARKQEFKYLEEWM